jgi:hypothetical protein
VNVANGTECPLIEGDGIEFANAERIPQTGALLDFSHTYCADRTRINAAPEVVDTGVARADVHVRGDNI